ncbi:MAG: glycosyl transferase family 1 [Shinella sp.]|nr:MAG: glycosyl transferase family 1 [Shinella sp.]
MKVLHFFKTYWPDTFGGVERTIHALAKGGRAHGIEADVLSLSRSPIENTREFDGHMAYKAKLDLEFASTGFSREAFSRFRELSTRADVVHYHFPWPFMDVVHLLSPPGKPTVVTYHSDIVKQKTLLRLYAPLMHRLLSSVDRIVATSPNYLMTSEVLQRHREKTLVIPIGLDPADYPRASEEEKAKWRSRFPRPFFLFVGVLRYYKGLHILLDAARAVDADIVIVGDGPTRQELEEKAASASLTNVHFLGALPDSAKAALLEICRGFVFPSHLRSEAYGLSLVEAAMFGKPMISCEIGTGTSFVNQDDETGIVVPPQDPAALAAAMNRLLLDDVFCRAAGLKASERAQSVMSAASMTAAYANLYRQIV